MDKQIIWSAKARQELFDILEFWSIHNHSNAYSLSLYKKIQINLKYISENHFIGKSTNINNVRVLVISNYLLFYEITENYIEILSLFDARRNPKDFTVK